MSIAPSIRFRVLARYGHRCAYCGRGAPEGVALHVDHVIPRCLGGSDEEENLAPACVDCNLGKGGKMPDIARGPIAHAARLYRLLDAINAQLDQLCATFREGERVIELGRSLRAADEGKS